MRAIGTRRSGKPVAKSSLADEWRAIVTALTGS